MSAEVERQQAARGEAVAPSARLEADLAGPPELCARAQAAQVGMASRSAGCMYCSSHTAETASVVDGVPAEKVAAIWDYETSDLFDNAERAVLRMAQGAGASPNAVSDQDMEELHKYFDDDQIVELVAAVCLFGWLNRWNDTMATDLEPRPLEFGLANLSNSGWEPGKHVTGD